MKEILQSLASGKPAPVYFLHGEESYYAERILQYVEHDLLTPEQAGFDKSVFYGKDSDVLGILDAARRYPVLSPFQVVVVKEAQDLKRLDNFQAYVERPLPTTVLVIAYMHKKMDMRTKFAQTLKDKAVVYESKPLRDYQIPDFIKNYVQEHRRAVEADAVQLIADSLGNNLSKIANELDKLFLNIAEKQKVSLEAVQRYIGISKDYNVFELQKAIGEKNAFKAFKIAHHFAGNPKKYPFLLTIGSLFNYFQKIYLSHFIKSGTEKDWMKELSLQSEFFVKDYKLARQHYSLTVTEAILHDLLLYDAKAKGIGSNNTEEDALLQELLLKILHY